MEDLRFSFSYCTVSSHRIARLPRRIQLLCRDLAKLFAGYSKGKVIPVVTVNFRYQ